MTILFDLKLSKLDNLAPKNYPDGKCYCSFQWGPVTIIRTSMINYQNGSYVLDFSKRLYIWFSAPHSMTVQIYEAPGDSEASDEPHILRGEANIHLSQAHTEHKSEVYNVTLNNALEGLLSASYCMKVIPTKNIRWVGDASSVAVSECGASHAVRGLGASAKDVTEDPKMKQELIDDISALCGADSRSVREALELNNYDYDNTVDRLFNAHVQDSYSKYDKPDDSKWESDFPVLMETIGPTETLKPIPTTVDGLLSYELPMFHSFDENQICTSQMKIKRSEGEDDDDDDDDEGDEIDMIRASERDNAAVNLTMRTRRVKALIIGINYNYTPYQLRGCIGDATRIKNVLTKMYGFDDNPVSMVVLTDAPKTPPLYRATRKNMIAAMHWLTYDNQPGDLMYFHYAGHGDQVKDYTGMEADELNETIVPCDFIKKGQIIDDELHALLVEPLKSGTKLIAVLDSCHSGTAFDLPYNWNYGKGSWIRDRNARRSKGDVVLFSSCMDKETSMDAKVDGMMRFYGVMSVAFAWQLVRTKKGEKSTYSCILNIKESLETRFKQSPQLSSNYIFNPMFKPLNFTDIYNAGPVNSKRNNEMAKGAKGAKGALSQTSPTDVLTEA